jgi:hypothetical protein
MPNYVDNRRFLAQQLDEFPAEIQQAVDNDASSSARPTHITPDGRVMPRESTPFPELLPWAVTPVVINNIRQPHPFPCPVSSPNPSLNPCRLLILLLVYLL